MKTRLILFSILLFGLHINAQEKIFTKTNGFRAMGTLCPGVFTSNGATSLYFSGDWDYYFNEHFSMNGEGHYFLANLTGNTSITSYHSLLWGMNYHFLIFNQLDPFVGMEPGFGFVDGTRLFGSKPNAFETIPLITFTVGTNFYVGSIFHFFIKARYLQGQSLSATDYHLSLSEFRFMGGLGWNLGVKNK